MSKDIDAIIASDKPRPYDLDDPQELQRLYRETRGYLKTCHYKHGTDWEGRNFAIEAFAKLIKVQP